MIKKISPSLMCADFLNLSEALAELERGGAEYLHIDVMDGVFVPNYALGTGFIETVRNSSRIPLDIHLMIDEPENKLSRFGIREGEYVSVHYEACRHVHRALKMIRESGAKPMIALNPATSLCVLEDILPDIDAVLIMTVNPGYAGQQLIPAMLKKIERLGEMLADTGIEIEVDGNVSAVNAALMSAAGADIFVAGSSGVFRSGVSICEGMDELSRAINFIK